MKNEKVKNIIIVLLIVIIILLLVIIGLILRNKVNLNNDNNVNNKNDNITESNTTNDENNTSFIEYQFGEEVILNQLSAIKDWSVDGEAGDFSKWNVIEDNGEYVTLYSSNIWKKGFEIDENSILSILKKYQIELGNDGLVRGLNENDLKLLGCDINTLVCINTPDWAGYGLTSVKINGSNIIFYGKTDFSDEAQYKLRIMEVSNALVPIRPVIKILKSNIQ